MDGVSASSYKPSTGLRHAQSLENVSWNASPRKKNWSKGPLIRSKSTTAHLQQKLKQHSFVVLCVDENCPIHGSRGKCTCASSGNKQDNYGMGSSESLYRSDDYGQQNHGSSNNLVSASVQPFNNNPSLPSTQRDIVGNNLQFNSSFQHNGWADDENDQLAALLLYRDALKKNLTTSTKFSVGYPKMRHGRIGSQWRHIKQTNTYSGSNLMFIDGTVRVDDSIKYPIPRFGYPPMKHPQHRFSASYNDLSNQATKSMDTMTWSGADALSPRASVSQHSSRFPRNAKDNSSYWPTDSTHKNTRSTNYPNDENNGYEPNQSITERIRPGLD